MAEDEDLYDDEMDEEYADEGYEDGAYEDEGVADEEGGAYPDAFHEEEGTLGQALAQQMKSAPWYLGSVGFHVVIFLILLAIPHEKRVKPKRRIVIKTEIVEEEEKPFEEPEIEMPEDPEVVTEEVVTEEPVVADVQVETQDIDIGVEMDLEDAADEGDVAIGDEDLGDIGGGEFDSAPAIMGLASGRRGGGSSKFGFRVAGREKDRMLRRSGGGKETSEAVNLALAWLAEHQEPQGYWKAHHRNQVGITSLALLAFLGDGNSTKFGKYRENVQRAVNWLLSRQNKKGMIGGHRYECGIALMALAEAYGMSNDRRIKKAAERLGDYCSETQSSTGGWEYRPTEHASDASVTGWYIMGLKSAKVADIKIARKTYKKALECMYYGTRANGTTFYKDRGKYKKPEDLAKIRQGSVTMGAVALTTMQFLGRRRDDPKVIACAERQMRVIPDPDKDELNIYLLYYQALGLFQMGTRSHYWKAFNEPMKELLLRLQIKEGTVREHKGSWDLHDKNGELMVRHGEHYGRAGLTALCALTLQVYYRYKDVHGR